MQSSFFADLLNIRDITPFDIDCAHRLGEVKDGKQTLLIRFFRREIAENLLRSKKMLKGRGFLMFEDSSYLNRELLKALNRRPEVENQWITGGRVYAKLQNCTKKVLFLITDDLDLKIAQNRPTVQPTAAETEQRLQQRRKR